MLRTAHRGQYRSKSVEYLCRYAKRRCRFGVLGARAFPSPQNFDSRFAFAQDDGIACGFAGKSSAFAEMYRAAWPLRLRVILASIRSRQSFGYERLNAFLRTPTACLAFPLWGRWRSACRVADEVPLNKNDKSFSTSAKQNYA